MRDHINFVAFNDERITELKVSWIDKGRVWTLAQQLPHHTTKQNMIFFLEDFIEKIKRS